MNAASGAITQAQARPVLHRNLYHSCIIRMRCVPVTTSVIITAVQTAAINYAGSPSAVLCYSTACYINRNRSLHRRHLQLSSRINIKQFYWSHHTKHQHCWYLYSNIHCSNFGRMRGCSCNKVSCNKCFPHSIYQLCSTPFVHLLAPRRLLYGTEHIQEVFLFDGRINDQCCFRRITPSKYCRYLYRHFTTQR